MSSGRNKIEVQRFDAGAPSFIRLWKVLGDVIGDRIHVRLGLRQCHAALEFPHHEQLSESRGSIAAA